MRQTDGQTGMDDGHQTVCHVWYVLLLSTRYGSI